MTAEESKIWELVHEWCNGLSLEIPDQSRRFLMDHIQSYAEPYRREKMKEGLTEENLPIYNKGLNDGAETERDRILGIIKEEVFNIEGIMNYDDDGYESGKLHALTELTQKIKQ